ncbi:uncharacterized protein LOC134711282 [Mytilus trossulus]|uniref:uncharacterized protein LOC134711282 n=1 Tax=Mytilus trossulus TaxID=6551 RepID=UPI00300436DD
MSEVKVSKRGRKRYLTDSERKQRRAAVNAKQNKNRIYIGTQYDRWIELKSILRVQTHTEVANVLLDSYEKHNSKINQRTPVPNEINNRPTSPPHQKKNKEDTPAINAGVVNTRDVCSFEDQPDIVEPVEDSEARKNQETIMKLILTSESSIFLEWPDNEIYIQNDSLAPSDDEFPEYIIQYEYDKEAIAMEDQESLHSEEVKMEMIDTDGIHDNEFYVVYLDHVYCRLTYVDFGELVYVRTLEKYEHERTRERFNILKGECKINLTGHANFELVKKSKYVRYIELYDTENPTIQTCITIYENSGVEIIVHGQKLSDSHAIWKTLVLPSEFVEIEQVQELLQTVSYYTVCIGNPDPQFLNNLPLGDYGNRPSSTSPGYLEENFGAYYRYFHYNRTFRSSNCSFLSLVVRCKSCNIYRKTLINKKNQLDWLHGRSSH